MERTAGACPIYAFLVDTHPNASAEAAREKLEIRQFRVIGDMLADVEDRCQQVRKKMERRSYERQMRRNAFTKCGM